MIQAPPLSLAFDQNSVLQITGKARLSGSVKISGAKNSALAIMAGALLCADHCRLTNVPSLLDIERMSQVLTSLGIKITKTGHTLEIETQNLQQYDAPYDLVSQLRASFFIIGPLLTRLGIARIPLPGGCAIGARPVDLHVRGLQSMGADVHIEHGVVHAYVKGKGNRLKGTRIYLDYPSVGATETLMMAATLADGETTLENAAQEPEVIDLANFCRAMGARIKGAGTNTISIDGVKSLHAVEYEIIPDRIEAGTFLVAGAITQSAITLSPVIPEHLTAVIAKLEAMGAKIISTEHQSLSIIPGDLYPIDIETMPYPGFPTDMQAQFMALLSIVPGNSIISETVFENRLHHVAELNRMGANIRLKGNHAFISGVPQLSGAPVMATDLRASAALVLAGLAAEGTTTMQGLHHLDRGYDHLEGKLRSLGANIHRITEFQ
ncbi:UDP-N-acetylglucosamine 1-carboxyvinyltransferase [Gloeocapsa sp. PCC 73106]|uniref:UDP-N-acetylglucosamine 1-carboxyvinyltransferase n=1 Tax=Gloeocapsa sp. PCC 73106 TaxID=102232 RepID=UPI0002AC895E|nr:UDP-N-acetylglucosamine 1-carboxyvinyltransferase [Gloeocapsa sp. PCC 73106]ELR97099.1 UDP-N-acetylglucosamine 1-carboxyvinyltransferase [Gloeocapsa sp. PCC 73106]